MDQQYLTVAQVAERLNVSLWSVYRKFAKLPGVIDLGSEETRFKRRYRVLRIPQAILDRYLLGLTVKPATTRS